MQRCRVALYLPTRCRVPTSAHDLPRLSPVGTKPDAHRIGSRAPLGLALRAAELQACIPMVCPIPQTAGRTLPAYPFPLAGRLSVSLHTLVHGRLTVGVKRHSHCEWGHPPPRVSARENPRESGARRPRRAKWGYMETSGEIWRGVSSHLGLHAWHRNSTARPPARPQDRGFQAGNLASGDFA